MDTDVPAVTAKPRVAEWFAGRTILVTGGTGLMGKVLLEKLLRSCPDLERILVLVRQKRGSDSKARIKQMLLLPLFEKLQTENPRVLEKLCPIEGDMTKPGLGLSAKDRKTIVDHVSVVFNCAASVRMDLSLKEAVQSNVVSTLRLLELAEEINELAVFLHLSSTFCHCEEEVVGEQTYPPPAPPHSIIDMVNWMTDKDLEAITPSLLGAHPNTYTFTKHIAEDLVREKGAKLHAVIARPCIVVPTWREPIPGWVDSLNGPIGISVALGKGVLRSMLANVNCNAEVIPVDIGINLLIIIAWAVGNEKRAEVPVYNVTQSNLMPITWGEIHSETQKAYMKNPFENIVWYPNGTVTSNKLSHALCVVFFHYLPAYFIDFILLLLGRQRFMVRVQKKISAALQRLQYFAMRQWRFLNSNLMTLVTSLCAEDMETFYTVSNGLDAKTMIHKTIIGVRAYCLKEPLTSLPRCRRHLRMLYCVHLVFTGLFYAFTAWLFYHMLKWTLNSVSQETIKKTIRWYLHNRP